MDRRTFVAATGATLASIGIAGCSTNGDGAAASPEETEGSGGTAESPDGAASSPEVTDGSDGDGGIDLSSVDGTLGDNVSDSVEVTAHQAFQTAENVGVTG